jgi:hypothetical protein
MRQSEEGFSTSHRQYYSRRQNSELTNFIMRKKKSLIIGLHDPPMINETGPIDAPALIGPQAATVHEGNTNHPGPETSGYVNDSA